MDVGILVEYFKVKKKHFLLLLRKAVAEAFNAAQSLQKLSQVKGKFLGLKQAQHIAIHSWDFLKT